MDKDKINNVENLHDEDQDELERNELENEDEQEDQEDDLEDHANAFDNEKDDDEEAHQPPSAMTNRINNIFKSQEGGLGYMLVGGVLLAIISLTYLLLLSHIPPVQFTFIIYLFFFLTNYVIIRDAYITPFLVNKESNSSKVAATLSLLSIVFTAQAMQYIAIESALTIFFWAGVLGLLMDKAYGVKYSSQGMMFTLLAMLGVLFVFRPPFIFGSFGSAHYIGHWGKDGYVPAGQTQDVQSRILQESQMSYMNIERFLTDNTTVDENSPNDFSDDTQNGDDNNQQVDDNDTPQNDANNTDINPGNSTDDKSDDNVDPEVGPSDNVPVVDPPVEPAVTNESNPFLGMGFALAGSLCFAISATQVRTFGKNPQGQAYSQMTINHIFCLFIVVFLPAFFPMEGVQKPSLIDWGIMIVLGVILFFAESCLMKAFQDPNGGVGKTMALSSLSLLGVVIAQIANGHGFGSAFWGIVGCVLIIVSAVMLSQEESSESDDNDFQQDKFEMNNEMAEY